MKIFDGIIVRRHLTCLRPEAKHDFWNVNGSFIHRHHVQERHTLWVLQESSFPVPLKYIDDVRRTNTALDVLQEHEFDDWNVDGRAESVRAMDGLHPIDDC